MSPLSDQQLTQLYCASFRVQQPRLRYRTAEGQNFDIVTGHRPDLPKLMHLFKANQPPCPVASAFVGFDVSTTADLNLGDFNDATKASHETTDCSGYTEALQPSNPSAEQPAIAGALVEAGAPGIGEHKPCSSTPRIFSSDNSFPGDKKRNRTRIEVEGSESDRNSHLSRSRCHGLAGQLIDLTSDNDKSDDEIMDGDDLQNSVARNEATKRPRVQNQRFKAQPQNLPQQTSASSTQNNRTGLATVLRGRLGIPAFAGRGAATSDLVPVDLAGEDTSCSSELEKGGSSSDSDVSEDDVGFIPLLKAKQQATVEAVGAPAPGVDSSTRASAARRGTLHCAQHHARSTYRSCFFLLEHLAVKSVLNCRTNVILSSLQKRWIWSVPQH